MNLSKRVGLNINRRQNSSDKKHNSSFSRGGSGEGPGLPPYFVTKLRLEGPKKICCETGSPPPPLISGSGWPPRPRYLKVWIRHWLVSFSFLYAVIWPALYKFFDGHWNIRNCRSNFRDIFYHEKNYKRNWDLWSFLVGVLLSNSQSEGAACCKGRNFGAKLTKFCGFWLEVSHEKKHLSRFWLDV